MRNCRTLRKNETYEVYTSIYRNSSSNLRSEVILLDVEKVESIMIISLMGFADSWGGRCVLLYTTFPEYSAF